MQNQIFSLESSKFKIFSKASSQMSPCNKQGIKLHDIRKRARLDVSPKYSVECRSVWMWAGLDLAGSGLARFEQCLGGLGVGMSAHNCIQLTTATH